MTVRSQAGPVRAGVLSLWHESEGSGPPLLLIAGLGYASWCWTELRERLAGRAEVHVFDNRGTGRSDKPAGPYSIAMLADDTAALLAALGLDSVHVLGHSMGGYIAQALALRHPGRVRSLLLACTSRGGPDTESMPPVTAAAWAQAAAQPPEVYARTSMPNSFAPGWTDRHPAEFEALLARRLRFPTPPENWKAQFDGCVEHVLKGLDVSPIRVPVTIVHGRLDRVVPYRNGELLAQSLPHARFVTLDAVGHLPMLEEPDAFGAIVRDHMNRVTA